MAQIIQLDQPALAGAEPAQILRGAIAANLDDVLVIGWTAGGELYAASSTADATEHIWLMECLKNAILNGDYDVLPQSSVR
jgi:hypothetical protein